MQCLFTKKVPLYFVGGEETLCFIFTSFPISKSFIPNVYGTNYDLKFIQYGFEIFQTVLSLSCKIMQRKTSNLVINLSLISNKAPNLFSAIVSGINTVSDTNLILLHCKIQGVAISLGFLQKLIINWKKILQLII